MQGSEVVVLGIASHVVCLRKSDGLELWRTKLRRCSLVTVVVDDDCVFAIARGYLYSLRTEDGSIRWISNLPKLGFGTGVMSSGNQTATALLNAAIQEAAIISAAAGAAAGVASGGVG